VRGWTAAFALAACACCACAGSYDDFARGVTANNRDESDVAIAAFTSAINAGDLAPAYVPAAYRGRGRAYVRKQMWKEALADFDAVIALKGPKPDNLISRAGVKLNLKDVAGAQQDFLAAAGKDPSADTFWVFARMEWDLGFAAEAVSNMKTAVDRLKGDSTLDPYILIWYAALADRGGTLDSALLASHVAALKTSEWPVPVLDLYLGKMTPDEVAREAHSWRDQKDTNQMCEADFYTAEWQLARKNRDAAIPLLIAAAKKCPTDFIEYGAARSELKREAPDKLPPEEDE